MLGGCTQAVTPSEAVWEKQSLQSSRAHRNLPVALDFSGTFSIVAVDPDSGLCGAAVASKVPSVGRIVPYARAGVGAFCTQHAHEPKWGERALDLLAQGSFPEEVLFELIREDVYRDRRQLAIVDMKGRVANRNPVAAAVDGQYWGAMSGRFYSCQGNFTGWPGGDRGDGQSL